MGYDKEWERKNEKYYNKIEDMIEVEKINLGNLTKKYNEEVEAIVDEMLKEKPETNRFDIIERVATSYQGEQILHDIQTDAQDKIENLGLNKVADYNNSSFYINDSDFVELFVVGVFVFYADVRGYEEELVAYSFATRGSVDDILRLYNIEEECYIEKINKFDYEKAYNLLIRLYLNDLEKLRNFKYR